MFEGFSPKVKNKKSLIEGCGFFAIQPISKNEIVYDISIRKPRIITKKEADEKYREGFDYMLQVGDDQFVVTVENNNDRVFGYINHSCDPNCGIKEILKIVAMRDISAGEEIIFDYAMSESSDYEMKCNCKSKKCRKIITGEDWKIKELQNRYNGYFTDYIQRKIDALDKVL